MQFSVLVTYLTKQVNPPYHHKYAVLQKDTFLLLLYCKVRQNLVIFGTYTCTRFVERRN